MTTTANWTVDEWLSHLESIHPSEIELGLTRIRAVGEQLGCLKPAPLVILVGGTNGKGTTTSLLTNLLMAQGLNVGRYNSPHILRYNERVSVNNIDISDEDLLRSFAAVEAGRGDTSLTYFEFGTLSALWHFANSDLDAVVLEIGLGGRLDAVNIADADISVVTSIGLDHMSWLGDTVGQIAYEKCSIARPDRWLVCGQADAPGTAAETVSAIGGRFCAAGETFGAVKHGNALNVHYQTPTGTQSELSFSEWHIPYPNIATAIQTLALVDRLPSEQTLVHEVASLRVPGRMQRWQRGDLTLILDVAHNPQAAAWLASQQPAVDVMILGMLGDKDIPGVIAALPQSRALWLSGLDCYRGLAVDELAQRAEAAGYPAQRLFPAVADALQALPPEGVCLVAGSFHTVEAATLWLNSREDEWTCI